MQLLSAKLGKVHSHINIFAPIYNLSQMTSYIFNAHVVWPWSYRCTHLILLLKNVYIFQAWDLYLFWYTDEGLKDLGHVFRFNYPFSSLSFQYQKGDLLKSKLLYYISQVSAWYFSLTDKRWMILGHIFHINYPLSSFC